MTNGLRRVDAVRPNGPAAQHMVYLLQALLWEDRLLTLSWCPRTALILGILYLSFQAFPIIFSQKHGFNMQMSGMTFLGIGIGMIFAVPTQRFWNKFVFRLSLISPSLLWS